MEYVGRSILQSFDETTGKLAATTCTRIRKSPATRVHSYMDLAKKVAELQFANRDQVLLFRGQSNDFKNSNGATSLKPNMFRAKKTHKVPTASTLTSRYQALSTAEEALIDNFESLAQFGGKTRLIRQSILRWSIIQHYEICETPLLDVTHSLRIAASFASLGSKDEAYIMILGVPNLSGAITASAEAGLQIVRLSSVCPPSAVRPHIQEGYLLGEYPDVAGVKQKEKYKFYEVDFGRRLVAKFVFSPEEFWRNSEMFPPLSKPALYPEDDPISHLAKKIKCMLKSESV